MCIRDRLYPEKGETWGVDDATGYIAEDGTKYNFIAYYCHFLWYMSQGSAGLIPHALVAFMHAYQATGDPAYAEKGIILLDRIACLLYTSYLLHNGHRPCPYR